MADGFKFPDETDGDDIQVDTSLADGGEVQVEVVDDTPTKDQNRQPLSKPVADPSDEELESYSDKVKKRLAELTHARHDERRAKESLARERAELERVAQTLLEENRRLKQHVNTGEQHLAATAQHAAAADLEMARKKLKEAHEAFDTDAIIAAQEQLNDAQMRANAAKNFRPTTLQVDQDVVQLPKSEPAPVDLDEKTLRWQQQNQWFGAKGQEEMTSMALGLHQKLVNSGIDPRSDEYFEKIDSRMRSVFPDFFGEDKPRSSEGTRRQTSVVAPASRSTGKQVIRLTVTQVALAKKLGLTPQQYAAQVAKLES